MIFEQFENDLRKALGTDVSVQYGSCGSNYTKILAIKNNKIVEIGEFIYRTWQECSNYNSTKKMLADMLVEAIKFYYGKRDKIPCLSITDYQE